MFSIFSINCREYLKKKTITDYFERARYFYSIEKSDEPKINENWFKKKNVLCTCFRFIRRRNKRVEINSIHHRYIIWIRRYILGSPHAAIRNSANALPNDAKNSRNWMNTARAVVISKTTKIDHSSWYDSLIFQITTLLNHISSLSSSSSSHPPSYMSWSRYTCSCTYVC